MSALQRILSFTVLFIFANQCAGFNSLAHKQQNLTKPNAASTSVASPQAFKVSHQNESMLHKAAITFHHGVLEVKYQQGFIILDLNNNEIESLRSFGFKVEKADLWQQKYEQHIKSLAQSKSQLSANQASGIPGYPCYPTVEETFARAQALSQNYAGLAEWIDIGDSWSKANGQGGYDLMVLKVTNQAVVKDKPILFIHSAMHARELTTAALTLEFAEKLLGDYATDADSRFIINEHEVHFLFQMNPDGRKIAESGVYQRKNTNQNHCPGSDVGVDLNRNFAFFWNTTANGSSGEPCNATYRGPSAESEPETIAVSNYIRSLYPDERGENEQDPAPTNKPGLHLDMHSYSELVLWPYGQTRNTSPNDIGFKALGNKLAWFNNYTPTQSVGLYPTDGTSDDVSYGELGVAAITFELGTSFFQSCGIYQNEVRPDNFKALKYAAKVVAAPYELARGPEVTQLELNGSESLVTVAKSGQLNVKAVANATLTKLSSNNRTISKVIYSIDSPIGSDTAGLPEFEENDGNLSSGVEEFSTNIDVSSLSVGEHILYTQAFSRAGQPGVVSAKFFMVAENSSPVPQIDYSCTFLVCEFDASASSDSDGVITSYLWTLDQTETLNGTLVSHTFSEEGSKTIQLTITDNTGNQASTSLTIEVVKEVVVTPPVETPEQPQSSSGGGSNTPWSLTLLCLWCGIILIQSRQSRKLNWF
ncbi:M14 family zinc carboxypeptidase [Aliikangiella sp. IMCC44653]